MQSTDAASILPALDSAIANTREALLAQRAPGGHWVGRLATSALSTATAAIALHLTDAARHRPRIEGALDWLARHANDDGGWGDTPISKSNINTTALGWAAFAAAPHPRPAWDRAQAAANRWLTGGSDVLEPTELTRTILAFYGSDRTFSTPILTALSLMGRLGPREQALARVPQLPFELAAFPHTLWRWLRLPVVSYALPALVAVGQTRHHYVPSRNPLRRGLRNACRRSTIRLVRSMQASSGGFLEAIPLTSFITACLSSIGHREHTIVREAVRFLLDLVREDGGWPIDTCLSTWVTTLSVNALAAGGEPLEDAAAAPVRDWLLAQQYHYEHPFTHTPPGGWSWMDTDGAVPDADDTPGALLALRNLPADGRVQQAAERGIEWLLRLQNRNGGMPTFCRGWGKLPFDRSAADITAHAIRAMHAWFDDLPPALASRTARSLARAQEYLRRSQNPDGSWLPLWFGNQWIDDDRNPTYGTGRVLTALAELPGCALQAARKGLEWLLKSQGADGGWGGGRGGVPSVEETAIAVETIARWGLHPDCPLPAETLRQAVLMGTDWLIDHTCGGREFPPAPIGLYFAKLWYYEKLYPFVFALSAMHHARRFLTEQQQLPLR
ncbi:MAG: prenyltransferase/squalene oxidase repeat-containing protein [Phycisphaerae bacterium]